MRNLVFTALFMLLASAGFTQTTCGDLPVALPDVKASYENADVYLQEHLPASIGTDLNSHGVFKILVDCEGVVGSVVYQNGELTEQQESDLIDVIEGMVFTPAVKDGEDVKTYVFMSLKITSGQATCGLN